MPPSPPRDHIAAETLTVQWSETPLGGEADEKVDGQALKIGVRKV